MRYFGPASQMAASPPIGYMQGNVRFISVMANLARQTFTDEQLINFCKAVSQNHE